MDADLTPELRLQVEEHVRQCKGCRAIYDGVRNVIMLVSERGIIELPSGFSARLYQRLSHE